MEPLSGSIDSSSRTQVYLVGAGPGDPGLLTLRAVECLRIADFVLVDYLSSPRAIEHVRPGAEVQCVDALPGAHPQRWPHIHDRIIEEARRGKIVVHLKGGDPFIFGRGGEEMEALRTAGIRYEVVPGVTAAFAAAACTEIPLTHRESASAVAIITGHEHPAKENSRLNWSALAEFPGTLAIYMGVARVGMIAAELVSRGKPSDTPVALVHKASTGEQLTLTGTLATIEAEVRRSGVTAPSLIIVGEVVSRKPETNWFESRPLFGLRVVVTRPQGQSLETVARLESLGAVVDSLPVIDTAPPEDREPLDRAVRELGGFDWVVFTSANGVDAFFAAIESADRDVRSFGKCRIAAIGSATARALGRRGIRPDLVPPPSDADSEGLIRFLADHVRGKRVLLAQAAEARPLLRIGLSELADITAVEAYRQVNVLRTDSEVLNRLRRGEIHAVLLTSPNITAGLLDGCDDTIRGRFRQGTTRLVGNSERLGKMLNDRGFACRVSAEPSIESMIVELRRIQAERLQDSVEDR